MTRTIVDEGMLDEAKVRAVLADLANAARDAVTFTSDLKDASILLAGTLRGRFEPGATVALVTRSEDADGLAAGFIEEASKFLDVRLSCCWLERTTLPEPAPGFQTSQVVRKYEDVYNTPPVAIIVLTSVVNSGTDARTLALSALTDFPSAPLHFMGPIMAADAEAKLGARYPFGLVPKVTVGALAYNDQVSPDGHLSPGIGGSVASRLKYQSDFARIATMPRVVGDRLAARSPSYGR